MDSKKRPIVQQAVGEMRHLGRAPDFDSLVSAIVRVHEGLQSQAAKAVNVCLTLRNWLIGCHLREYEQKGNDRAAYGDHLFEKLAERLQAHRIPRLDERELRRYRQFYLAYPMIREALPPKLARRLPATALRQIRESVTPESKLAGRTLVDGLSFTHFAELLQIDDPLKRAFYEVECLRGNWSVRELKRQVASLYYERAGLSTNKKKLSDLTQAKAQPQSAKEIIHEPYVFEFLGLKPKEAASESDVEDALLDKLQDFLLELGHGFCFEARQKRILIGGEHFFLDLVFYHRILKCHVLIELKADDFKHEHLGQLNTYVNWYRKHEAAAGDNPPIGILLCTKKNRALVEYALAGMDNRLFVSKYQLELPKKEEIRRFIEDQMMDRAPVKE
ncbi:MAG: PDDEXK nuclease domain-containing protein [Elusimicrobia bacterium]|nr:PDDEXK nuclease domain-containing protein [Elusimicrobiota bacterium]